MSSPTPGSPTYPRILVIGRDPALREFCRDGLPWAGCATEFARDIADAMTIGFVPDVLVADLPAGPHSAAMLQRLREFAAHFGSTVIALTDDRSLVEHGSTCAECQVLFRPCPPEALWDALAIAMARETPVKQDDWRKYP